MKRSLGTVGSSLVSASVLVVALGFGLASGTAHGDAAVDGGTTQTVYGNIPADQVEFLSTPDRIKSVAANGAPMAIWETLEHGEDVECMECIPSVAPLLYATDSKTREIAAWWLRRRMFGVFGDGEVYQGVVNTLASDPDATKRAQAATALGEFLIGTGITPVATALTTDSDEGVRAAAASALGRLNDAGNGALSKALGDSAASVKLAALDSAIRINGFSDATSVVKLLGDTDAGVRRRSAEALESLHATGAVASLVSIAQSDSDEQVRIAACHALGALGDSSASSALTGIATNDKSGLVRDTASIALQRL